jgi:hypothetical protein
MDDPTFILYAEVACGQVPSSFVLMSTMPHAADTLLGVRADTRCAHQDSNDLTAPGCCGTVSTILSTSSSGKLQHPL